MSESRKYTHRKSSELHGNVSTCIVCKVKVFPYLMHANIFAQNAQSRSAHSDLTGSDNHVKCSAMPTFCRYSSNPSPPNDYGCFVQICLRAMRYGNTSTVICNMLVVNNFQVSIIYIKK